VKELAADGIPVVVTCRVLKLARQPYYRWLADPVTDAEYLEAHRARPGQHRHGTLWAKAWAQQHPSSPPFRASHLRCHLFLQQTPPVHKEN
jgi:hypothetical protein